MSATRNARQWEPVVAPVQSAYLGKRTPEALRAVVAQFDVEANPRYRKTTDGRTWCNIFCWDVTSALGCEVPHWVEKEDGTRGELNVNATVDWLTIRGPDHGWREVDERDAAAHAGQGGPALAIWRNPNPKASGHVAVLLPPRGETRIAQAGRRNFAEGTLRAGFGDHGPVRFFVHS
jgi:hypothetical protein